MSETSTLIAVDAGLRGALIAALLLLTLGLVHGHAASLVVRSWVLLALGLAVQTVAAAPEVELQMDGIWQSPLVAISVGNGVVFWVFAKILFDDDFRPGLGHSLFWLVVALSSAINCAFGADLSPWLHRILELVQRATPLLCAVLVVLAAGSHWTTDLVERRRSLRAFITVGGVIYSVVLLALRLSTSRGTLSPSLALVDTSILLLLVGGVAARALVVQSPELLGFASAASHPRLGSLLTKAEGGASPVEGAGEPSAPVSSIAAPVSDPDRELAARIVARMSGERLYSRPDLTVASLATTLAVPEYRLRRTINQALGFRNFNAFVNSFRLAEAREALTDRNRDHLPILSIALETGFQSIGPFNRTFKTSTGLTPSEFREKYKAENANPLAESFNSNFRRDSLPLQS
jgi:AraC-like DNA-binding protein